MVGRRHPSAPGGDSGFYLVCEPPTLRRRISGGWAHDHVAENNPPPLAPTRPLPGHITRPGGSLVFTMKPVSLGDNGRGPTGYLVHNLEHGYVIFWYNCTLVTPEECVTLKNDLRTLIEEANHFKVIAFPWTTTDVPVVATSWGQMLREVLMLNWPRKMIQRNRNHAPEPNAQ